MIHFKPNVSIFIYLFSFLYNLLVYKGFIFHSDPHMSIRFLNEECTIDMYLDWASINKTTHGKIIYVKMNSKCHY